MTDTKHYVAEWHWNESWLDRDHLAFSFYRATKKGQRDKWCCPQTITIWKGDALANPTLSQLYTYLTEGMSPYFPENKRYYIQVFDGMNDRQWEAFLEIYPIARDYLIDQIGEPAS